MALPQPEITTKRATFGMSCFVYPEAFFGAAKGVIKTRNGYAGGNRCNPNYLSNIIWEDHVETVDIEYDPEETTFEELLDIFWKNHDPCLKNKNRYMSAIFCHDDEQTEIALKSWDEIAKKKTRTVVTAILSAKQEWSFHIAEP